MTLMAASIIIVILGVMLAAQHIFWTIYTARLLDRLMARDFNDLTLSRAQAERITQKKDGNTSKMLDDEIDPYDPIAAKNAASMNSLLGIG